MLGKLIKHEFKDTAKIMLTLYGFLMIVTLAGAVALFPNASAASLSGQGAVPENPLLEFLSVAMLILYIFAAFALFIITYVYMCMHFYKTMYSAQGYLTHTLPVSSTTIFHAKLIVSSIWMITSLLLFFLSLFILLIGASHGTLITALGTNDLMTIGSEFESIFGMSLGGFAVLMFFLMVLSCLSFLLMVFASASIGQLFNTNKLAASIVTFIVLSFAQQVLGSLLSLLMGISMTDSSLLNVMTFAELLTSPPMIASFVLSVVFMAAFYITNIVILKKHINLD